MEKCRQVQGRSVVERCCEEVFVERLEKCSGEVLQRRVVKECCGEVLW